MRIPINLASKPFRRDRAMIVASSLVCALLVVTLAGLLYLARQDRQQTADIRHEINGLKQQIQALSTQQGQLDGVMHQPANEIALENSAFINSLLLRKGISWNQIFSDLEKTLPYNVKLQRIRPSVDDQGHVVLDMTLAAETNSPVVNALKAFRENTLFGAVEWKQLQPPTQTDPLFRVVIDVTYAQKL